MVKCTISLCRKKNAIAGFIGAFFGRNNDIDGYWAIGKICRAMIERKLTSTGVEFVPSCGTMIYSVLGMELPRVAEFYRRHIAGWNMDGTTFTIQIFVSGPVAEPFDNGRERYQISVEVELKSNQRIYRGNYAAYCWLHDPLFELRRWQFGASNR